MFELASNPDQPKPRPNGGRPVDGGVGHIREKKIVAVVVVVVSVFLLQPTSAIATINGVANFNAVDIVLSFHVFGLYWFNNECYYQSVD